MNWTEYMLLALSGELNEADRRRLEEALAKDERLRKEWTELQTTQALLGAQRMRVQPFLATRVMQRLQQDPVRSLGQAFTRLVMPVLAATLLLLAVTYVQEDNVRLDTLTGASELSVEDLALSMVMEQ